MFETLFDMVNIIRSAGKNYYWCLCSVVSFSVFSLATL